MLAHGHEAKALAMDDPTALINDHDFVVDFARFSEGILDEKFLRKKYRFTDEVWSSLGENDALAEAIEAEKLRRVRDGSAKRELAQKHIVRGPDVLNSIMMDAGASPKHRIDASKTLDQFAGSGSDAAAADSTRFIIQINLGDDHVERYNKSRAIDADDVDPDAASQGVVVAIPTKKSKKIAKKNENDDGEPV
jgi:hypothetical protein